MVVKRGVNDAGVVRHGPALPRHGPHRCASSSTWTSAHTNGWRLDDVVPGGRDRRARSTRSSRSSRSTPNYRGEVAQRWRYRDGAGRDRRHRLGHASRSAATAPGRASPPTGSSTPASSRARGHDLRALAARRRVGRATSRRAIAGIWARRDRPLLRDPLRADTVDAAQGGDVATSAGRPQRRSARPPMAPASSGATLRSPPRRRSHVGRPHHHVSGVPAWSAR